MTTSDIDLNFRPLSYFWPLGLASHLLATVKGAERRAMLQRLIDSDRLDLLTECLTKSHLSREERTSIGRIHPMFMGGEYLPSPTSALWIFARRESRGISGLCTGALILWC